MSFVEWLDRRTPPEPEPDPPELDRVLAARTRAGLPPTPPCSTCAKPAIGYRSWPDGTSVAWCADHADAPQQTSLTEGM